MELNRIRGTDDKRCQVWKDKKQELNEAETESKWTSYSKRTARA